MGGTLANMITAHPCNTLMVGERFVFCSFLFPIDCLFNLWKYLFNLFNPAVLATSTWCQNMEGVDISVGTDNSVYCGF